MNLAKAYRTHQQTGDPVVDAVIAALRKLTAKEKWGKRPSSLERFEILEAAVEDAKKVEVWSSMTAAQQRAGRKLLAEIYVWAHYLGDSVGPVGDSTLEFVPFGKTFVLLVEVGCSLHGELCGFQEALVIDDRQMVRGLETEGCCSKCAHT